MRPLENLPVSLWSSGTREAEPFPMLSAPGLVAATVPEILAIWEDRTKQLIDPNQKRCRHSHHPVLDRSNPGTLTRWRLRFSAAQSEQLRANFKLVSKPEAHGGSDVVSASQTGHLEATDYVGQASRRYRRNATPLPAPALPHPSALQGLRLLHNG